MVQAPGRPLSLQVRGILSRLTWTRQGRLSIGSPSCYSGSYPGVPERDPRRPGQRSVQPLPGCNPSAKASTLAPLHALVRSVV